MFRKIMMGTALIAAVAAFDPSLALARNGGGGGGAHFGGGGFARGGGGSHSFAVQGGGMRNSFASTNSGAMRNATVNRSFNNNARVSSNTQFHHWNNGNGGHGHHGWRHRGWGYGAGLALGYGLYNDYYDDPYAYYGDDYYDNYAYNDDYADQCYRAQRYHTRSGWHVRTVNVCQ